MLDRREFLRVSAATAVTGAATGCSTAGSSSTARSRAAHLGGGKPHRIIHVVADGMSLGTLSCADQLSRWERGHGLAWMDLCNHPAASMALMDMRSLDSLVTDSAAASSSWGSGSRVRNGTLNTSSKGKALVPLMQLFGQAGWNRGLVTTTEITHATPAGFTVALESRGEGEEIAAKYLERGLDLYLGGAWDHFDPAKRKDKRDLSAAFRSAGYQVVRSQAELSELSTEVPWLGLFAGGHLPYSIDTAYQPDRHRKVPSIAAMTARALERLEDKEHFLLQIEGGRVDHACHNNDAAAALRDMIAVDDALRLVLRFQQEHPQTLVVVTTDHGNANLGLNGMGTSYRDSSVTFRRLGDVKASFPEILGKLRLAGSEKEAAGVLAELAGMKVDSKKMGLLQPFVAGRSSALFDQMNSDVAALGQLLANHLGIGFVGTTHTSDYVPLLAIGPGADRFRGLIQNTDVFRTYTRLAGIDYRNPEEPLIAGATLRPDAEDVGAYAWA